MIDPAKRTVTIFRPGGEHELISGDSVAGFSLDLAEIWAV
jgi:hypothetical protein